MKKQDLIHHLLIQYFVCYAGTMFAVFLLCSATRPDILLPLRFLRQIALFALAADLPCVLYYSRRELSPREWWIRTAIHAELLETVLLIGGYWMGMYCGFRGGVAFAGVIMVVALFVRFIAFLCDLYTAGAINERLRQKRREDGADAR
ncbi:hypothetical protein SAMN05216343_1239 [Oscillibacter sp. PC13]|uniref:hypothetical protein n=1 Tax=Oscillibacter sp. PC13 TaxID=1855299 RepID=UPI0008F300ED|nr:hypothetical protein [Oscillibacter sp. PC13]SFQ08258.1 hypothetical protein SAMN05216343_1239 [Oscillibacter sp. PC13]